MAELVDRSTAYAAEGLLSLGGVPHRAGQVTPLRKINITVTGVAIHDLLEANPARLWARITNNDDTDYLIIWLGETGGYNEEIVQPHGSLQIDRDAPFCGRVRATTNGVDAVAIVHEMSVQP